MRRIMLIGMAWLGVACGVCAADAELGKSYHYRIILRIAPHRLLTPTFRRQLRDELQDGIQAALGSLAQVDVEDADGPAAKDWLDPTTLDAHSEVGPAKRHFVEVSFVDGRYVIRARQHDGSTGLASPVVREARTADRAFVGRLITRFIDQDFGPVGTVVGFEKTSDWAMLEFRGGGLAPTELARLVPTGSVFSLARIQGSPARGRSMDAAYLISVAEPKEGRCECRFVYRYQDQLADWSAVTFRALKLGTGQGPIRLRLVAPNGLPPQGLQVRVNPDSFQSKDARDQGAIRDGAFDTAHTYDRVAFVVVSAGAQLVAQIPVPVIDDRVTTCRVSPAAGGEARQQIELDARNLLQRFVDIGHRLTAQSERLSGLIKTQRNQEALDDVKRTLDVLENELAGLTAEVTRIRRDRDLAASNAGPMLDQCDVYAKEIQRRRDALRGWQPKLEEAIADEKKQEPDRVSFLALVHRAEAQQQSAEFDEALKTYDDILNRYGERENVRKLKERLEAEWQIKSDEHRRAREFVYGAWTNARTVDDIRGNLPKAREALATFKQAGDRLTPLKLLLTAPAAAEIMSKAVEEIEKSESEADKLGLPALKQLNDELQSFIKDVSAAIRPDEKKP